MRINIIEKILEKEPAYRLKQANSAVFKDLISDWQEALIFPQALRGELNKKCPLLIEGEILESKKGDAIKGRIKLEDGLLIECVLMRHKDGRNTVCVSSQVGCPLECKFCATGQMGFKRNLKPMEIVEQVLFFSRYLKNKASLFCRLHPSDCGREVFRRQNKNARVTNVVFMGMGEPFLNYENVIQAIRFLNNEEWFNIGARNISISTAGVTEGIKKLSLENIQVNLAVSLHAVNNEMRDKIMPANKKYPMEKIFEAVDDYIKKTKRQVMFEYLLIRGINDSDECAFELAKLMKRKLYFLNLILYNDTNAFVSLISYNETNAFQPSSTERVKKFKAILEKQGVKFSQRFRFGEDVKAACGQFAAKI